MDGWGLRSFKKLRGRAGKREGTRSFWELLPPPPRSAGAHWVPKVTLGAGQVLTSSSHMGRPGPWIGVDSQREPLGAKFPGTCEATSGVFTIATPILHEQTEVQGGTATPLWSISGEIWDQPECALARSGRRLGEEELKRLAVKTNQNPTSTRQRDRGMCVGMGVS